MRTAEEVLAAVAPEVEEINRLRTELCEPGIGDYRVIAESRLRNADGYTFQVCVRMSILGAGLSEKELIAFLNDARNSLQQRATLLRVGEPGIAKPSEGPRHVIYVASSWRNPAQPEVVERLRSAGHEVYDFRHPAEGDEGFSWKEIDDGWLLWTPEQFREKLESAPANRGFANDFVAMKRATAFVAVQPFGVSASCEVGWAAGAGIPTCVLLAEGSQPELMFKMFDKLALSMDEVLAWLDATPVGQTPQEDVGKKILKLAAVVYPEHTEFHLRSYRVEGVDQWSCVLMGRSCEGNLPQPLVFPKKVGPSEADVRRDLYEQLRAEARKQAADTLERSTKLSRMLSGAK